MNIKTLILSAVLLVGAAGLQAQSVAHVNTQEILEAIPAYQDAQKQLDEESQRHKTEIDRQTAEMEKIYKAAEKDLEYVQNPNNPEAERRKKAESLQSVEKDLQDKQEKLTEYQKNARQKVQELQNRLEGPIYKQVQEAINAVGKKKNIGYIFDLVVTAGSGSILYYEGGMDLTNDVKAELGVE